MSSPATRRRLPAHPCVEHLKKQAKRLARDRKIKLTEAQRQLAQDYGASSVAEPTRVSGTPSTTAIPRAGPKFTATSRLPRD